MIEENSGKFFRFKLDFDLGFGFAEVYDFTDLYSADGTKVFVYNRIDQKVYKTYTQIDITTNGLALGPISLLSYPNTRGIGAWKFLFKSNNYLIEESPITKEGQDCAPWTYDWNCLKKWYRSDINLKEKVVYLPYSEVRSLETRILNSNVSVAKKTTMKFLIDNGKKVEEYYDFNDIGNVNIYIQLVNTYYSLERCNELIKVVPPIN